MQNIGYLLAYLIVVTDNGNRTEWSPIRSVILQAKKFLKCDWLRQVVFKPNLKYLHVKITPVSMVTEK